ncbi:MAG TPA: DNA methyltransferase [Allosphingosinicella sp.]|jgi:hypothetical protein
MNAVEIEEAVSDLVAQRFDPAEFPFQFLSAFGAKETTLKRLRKGDSNASNVAGGVLQRNNIHIAVAEPGQVGSSLAALRASPKTTAQRAKFILATDGETVEAEDLFSDEPPIACPYAELPRHFGFFLPLAGISTVKEIKNNPIDVKATGRLNRLYVQLLKDNPSWGSEEKRPQLNQFMAQLIFCFFAEDTDIFHGSYKFTPTVERMTSGQSDNTQQVITELFRAMGTRPENRAAGRFPTWADGFPYVNGGYLFAGAAECPWFSRTARAYLLRAGELDWKEINPDIFGSMIQAVADDGERSELGMHYTSVPNILKVLNPLFLDDLRQQLEAAGDNRRKLQNLRKRLANIRVFDPACGSGNFLVIAYKEMRAMEAEIVDRLGGEANLRLEDRRSVIPLSNFYGIEIKSFAAEIARLALLIAEFQADCLYLSQQEARAMVLPLHKTGQITVGNALRLNWLEVCPAVGGTPVQEQDLGGPTGRLALDENGLGGGEQVETYICGNPPYKGFTYQNAGQKADLEHLLSSRMTSHKSLDYIAGWFVKGRDYLMVEPGTLAFVTTNSICQGEVVPNLWPMLLADGFFIPFAYTSFKWANLASHNAGVTVAIVGLTQRRSGPTWLFEEDDEGQVQVRSVDTISPYLVPGSMTIVQGATDPPPGRARMLWGNKPTDGGSLLLDEDARKRLVKHYPHAARLIRPFYGSAEFIRGAMRYCLWIENDDLAEAMAIPPIAERIENVRAFRTASVAAGTRPAAAYAHRFRQIQAIGQNATIIVASVSSEGRAYLPAALLTGRSVVSNLAFALYDAPLWNLALLASRLHLVWVATVCGKLKTDFRYSNTLGWNTFPVPRLIDQNKVDLTRTAENILLAREAHFPATIADLYDPDAMPDDLRRAHEENDEVLERIYIGRRFRNDTERLEKLFDLYTAMTADQPKAKKGRKAA